MRIVTDRLVLREFLTDDCPAVLRYQSDPRYLRLSPWTDRTEAAVREFVQQFVDQQAERPRRNFQLAITLPGGEQIGNCGIRRNRENDWEADIGYELAPQYWGQGYATEAARAIVLFGFQELGLYRIAAWCNADNLASAGVLEKVGLQLEGRLRENEYFKGRWWNALLYGLLEREWRASATKG